MKHHSHAAAISKLLFVQLNVCKEEVIV